MVSKGVATHVFLTAQGGIISRDNLALGQMCLDWCGRGGGLTWPNPEVTFACGCDGGHVGMELRPSHPPRWQPAPAQGSRVTSSGPLSGDRCDLEDRENFRFGGERVERSLPCACARVAGVAITDDAAGTRLSGWRPGGAAGELGAERERRAFEPPRKGVNADTVLRNCERAKLRRDGMVMLKRLSNRKRQQCKHLPGRWSPTGARRGCWNAGPGNKLASLAPF